MSRVEYELSLTLDLNHSVANPSSKTPNMSYKDLAVKVQRPTSKARVEQSLNRKNRKMKRTQYHD